MTYKINLINTSLSYKHIKFMAPINDNPWMPASHVDKAKTRVICNM